MIIKWLLMMALAFVSLVERSESVPVDMTAIGNSTIYKASAENRTAYSTERDALAAEEGNVNDTEVEESTDANSTTTTTPLIQSSRRGRVMDFSKLLNLFKPTEEDWKELTGTAKDDSRPIHGRILNGGASLDELADNTFANERRLYASPSKLLLDTAVNDKYDTALINVPTPSSSIKTYQPTDSYASVSYSNPAVKSEGISGYESSDLASYYHETGSGYSKAGSPVLYKLVPVSPSTHFSHTFTDAVKETLLSVGDKVKDHVSGTVQKVKNALGFNSFSEKVASPDTLLAVAPVAAGLLAGGLAVAYLASRAGQKNNASMPFNIFGKRSVRNAMTEEDLQHIVARLDPVQREYLQKLQLYGPQRWKDVTCAKYIFCDVMSRATPLHVRDMQRKIGVFLSRMEETTARYVEVILKDVMLAIQARDCSRFSCSQTTWGLPHGPPQPPPQPPPQLQPGGNLQGVHPFQFLPGNNFLRRQRAKN